MIAKDLMTANPKTIATHTRVREAVELLDRLDVRHLPVVDGEGALVGMLSDRDVRAIEFSSANEPVVSVMSSSVVAVEEEDDAEDAVDLMLENKIGAVPVIDGEGVLVGIISYVDVLREARLPVSS